MAAHDPDRRRAVARVAAQTRWTRVQADRLVAAREELEMSRDCPTCGQGSDALTAFAYQRQTGREPNECPRCGRHRPASSEQLAEQMEAKSLGTTPDEAARGARLYEYGNQLNKMRLAAKRDHNTPEEIALARRSRLRPGDLDARPEAESGQKPTTTAQAARLARSIRPTLDEFHADGGWNRRDVRDLLENQGVDVTPDLVSAVLDEIHGDEDR